MTLVCTSCEEDIDQSDWDEESQQCIGCFEVGGGAKYCCGMTYDDGEDTCRSCGEPL